MGNNQLGEVGVNGGQEEATTTALGIKAGIFEIPTSLCRCLSYLRALQVGKFLGRYCVWPYLPR